MHAIPVIAVFDVGKTNKKLLLFDEQYRVVLEQTARLPEIKDEDDFPCEDVEALHRWVRQTFAVLLARRDVAVKAVNFTAYGASFVYLDEQGKVLAPLYNYLKPYPASLQRQFFDTYGGQEKLAAATASPVLGSLNSGLQLFRLRQEQPSLFGRVHHALHLPQYLSFLLSATAATEHTSLGCHTLLWDFEKRTYHSWVEREGWLCRLAPLVPGTAFTWRTYGGRRVAVGVGLHDSSAALIPYLHCFAEPFVLISTGTWCISLNPFNRVPPTPGELQQDCLCYLSYGGTPVKASRLFAGKEHEVQVRRLAAHFGKAADHYTRVAFQPGLVPVPVAGVNRADALGPIQFALRNLSHFTSYEQAYHHLLCDIVAAQVVSTQLVLRGVAVKRIFVDGGFSRNPVYMHLLAAAFPDQEVYAASLAQATALGAALVLHPQWNKAPLLGGLLDVQRYTAGPPGAFPPIKGYPH